jgi:hypothetical protein
VKREQRKLRLVRRQAMLAGLSEREAMRSLAIALDEETRSAALKERSEGLARDYAARFAAGEGPSQASELAGLSRFAGALGLLARDAGRAHADATDQARWQVDALAAAQSRTRRLEEHLAAATAELERSQAARAALEECLARELQSRRHVPSAGAALPPLPGRDAG